MNRHDHNSHANHDMHNLESTTLSDDSCCPGTEASSSSAQHMMHHMMSVSYII